MRPRRNERSRRGGGPGGEGPLFRFSSPQRIIVDIGVPPPALPAPAPDADAAPENVVAVAPPIRWASPSPVPQLSELARTHSNDVTDLYNRNVQLVVHTVRLEQPNAPESDLRISPILAKKCLEAVPDPQTTSDVVRELMEFSQRGDLTEGQKMFVKKNLPFLTTDICNRWAKRSKAIMSQCHEPNMELHTPGLDSEGKRKDPLCCDCQDEHTPGPECKKIFDYGPLNPNAAHLAPHWVKDTSMIYVGSKETIYLPDELSPPPLPLAHCEKFGHHQLGPNFLSYRVDKFEHEKSGLGTETEKDSGK
jgi:hypothetical protein